MNKRTKLTIRNQLSVPKCRMGQWHKELWQKRYKRQIDEKCNGCLLVCPKEANSSHQIPWWGRPNWNCLEISWLQYRNKITKTEFQKKMRGFSSPKRDEYIKTHLQKESWRRNSQTRSYWKYESCLVYRHLIWNHTRGVQSVEIWHYSDVLFRMSYEDSPSLKPNKKKFGFTDWYPPLMMSNLYFFFIGNAV